MSGAQEPCKLINGRERGSADHVKGEAEGRKSAKDEADHEVNKDVMSKLLEMNVQLGRLVSQRQTT